MTDILFTRLLLWKKKVISMLFWFLLPILGTYLFITIANTIQEDSRVPIGIVMEDDSDLGHHVLESITESELVQVHETTKKEALYQLENMSLIVFLLSMKDLSRLLTVGCEIRFSRAIEQNYRLHTPY